MNNNIAEKRLLLLEKKQLDLLYGGIYTVFTATALNFTFLSYFLLDIANNSSLKFWYISNIILLLIRVSLTIAYYKRDKANAIRPWRYAFALSVFASGVMFGSGAFLIFPESSISHQTFIYFIAGGMVAGAAPTLGGRFEIYLLYAFTVLTPYIFKAFSLGSELQNIMGFILSLFLIFIAAGVFKIYKIIKKSFLLEIDNKDLILSLEEEILEKEEATAIKSQFLANMSHEIRTPMNAIMAMNQMALETPLSDKQRELLTHIDKSSTSLLSIINEILDFSKIEAGKLSLENAEFELWDLLDEVSQLCSIQAGEKDLEFIIDVAPDVPHTLMGDPIRIKQILLNPLSNAIKFTQSGEVVLKIALLSKNKTSVKLSFVISDTGIGMTPEHITHLFEEFSQADTSMTRKYGGTGLGLAIAKRLAKLMKGSITAVSQIDKGSTFTIDLELKTQKKPKNEFFDFAHSHRLNTLILTPNHLTTHAIEGIFKHLHWDFTSCFSYEELDLLIQKGIKNFDLVLIDFRFCKEDVSKLLSQHYDFFTKITHRFIIGNSAEKEILSQQPIVEKNINILSFLVKPILPNKILKKISSYYTSLVPIDTVSSINLAKKNLFSLGHKNILVVEDNLTNQLIIKLAFDESPFTITLAENGAQAVEKTLEAAKPFDIILMDIQMPVMNGYDATVIIRQAKEYQEVPIIALTANVLQEYEEKAKKIGMNGYFTKPIDMEDFYKKLFTYLS